jgi:hypothetical protein
VRLSGTDLADFAIASDTCSIGPLAPLATCTVSVVFKPGSGGATKTAVLTITETSSGASAAVTLSGTVAS